MCQRYLNVLKKKNTLHSYKIKNYWVHFTLIENRKKKLNNY